MKKICLGLVALMMSATLFAERVTLDDAALVANHFMNVESTTAPGVKKTPAKQMIRKATAEEAQYYLYENANGEGWVIVAANDVVTPILAYSETGHFRTDNMPSNLRNWMSKYDHFISKLEQDGVEASEETKAQWKALRQSPRKVTAVAVVGPLITSQWDQDDPYYNLCPGAGTSDQAYTGCVATAMAQVMNYWEWPKQGTGSHSYQPLDPNTGKKSSRYGKQTANFGATTYDWDNMLDKYTNSATSVQKTAVATLMFHCGVATEMMYGNDEDGGSGTYTVNYGDESDHACAQNALWMNFGYKKSTIKGYMRDGYTYQGVKYYDSWSDADWTAMVKEELDKQHPIMYGGASSEGGHSFICDGYDSNNKFHFNWGWSGSGDGYYTLSNLNPGSGGAGGGSYNFSEDQDVLIGIVPDRTDLPKVTVTWSVNGVTTTTEFTQEDPLVLPANPADCSDTRVFVGWTAQSTVSGDKPADLFTKATGKTVTEAITYYAVFADKSTEGGAPSEVASVTFKTAANDNNTDKSSSIKTDLVDSDNGIASYSGSKLYLGKAGIKLGNSSTAGTITLTLSSSASVSKVVVNASQYGSDTGKLTVTAGSTELGSQSPAANLEFVASTPVETNTITVATTSKRAYIASISVVAGNAASYSNYSLEGCASQDVEIVRPTQNANKVIENGQIVIIRGNEKYTLFGQKIQ